MYSVHCIVYTYNKCDGTENFKMLNKGISNYPEVNDNFSGKSGTSATFYR